MTTTEKITAGIMAAATLLLLKRNVLSTSGIGVANNQKPRRLRELIKDNILNSADTPQEAIETVRYCIENYGDEPDFNLAQSATIQPVSYWEIAELIKKAGYSEGAIKRMGDDRMWQFYLYNVGEAARELVPTRMKYGHGRWYYTLA